MSTLITNVGRLFTGTEQGVIENAAVLVQGDRVGWVGKREEAFTASQAGHVDEVADAGGALITPGLIDAHTHPVYAEPRLGEIAERCAGASYQQLAAEGGGIGSTVRSTQAASWDELTRRTADRLRRWLRAGTTTVEAKTGYWLNREGEVAAVDALNSLADQAGLPRLEVTFLPAHDVPPEFADEPSAHETYTEWVCQWPMDAAEAGARFIDVFCDQGYFSVDQARRILEAGQLAGLLPRLHADELAHTGGARLAAAVGAVSADHLLQVDEDDARALAASGVVATLCPATALALGAMPPARMLADHGVTLALGSDHNPGQSGITSMSLVVGLAVHLLGLSVEEALLAATAGAARSIAAPDRGAVRSGLLADLVLWDADHEGAFAWDLGLRPRWVMQDGALV